MRIFELQQSYVFDQSRVKRSHQKWSVINLCNDGTACYWKDSRGAAAGQVPLHRHSRRRVRVLHTAVRAIPGSAAVTLLEIKHFSALPSVKRSVRNG